MNKEYASNIFSGLTTNTDIRKEMINLKGVIKRKNQKTLAGKPAIHSSSSDEIKQEMESIAKEIDLQAIMWEMVGENSEWGTGVFLPSIGTDGMLSVVKQERQFTYKVVRYNNIPIYAVLWRAITFNRVEYRIQEVWDFEKVERFFIDPANQFVSAESFNAMLPKDMFLPQIEYHNLGILPVVQSFNYLTLDYTDPYMLSDLYYAPNLQQKLNETTFAWRREERNNITRIMLDQGYLADLDVASQMKAADSDIFIGLDGTDSKDGALPITILQADPKLDIYANVVKDVLQIASSVSGTSLEIGDAKGQSTATGTLFSKADVVETVNTKVIALQKYLRELMIKLYHIKKGLPLSHKELIDFDYDISIVPNIMTDEISKTDTMIKQLSAGLISRVKAKMAIDGVSQELAEVEIAEAQDDFDEYQEQEQNEGEQDPQDKTLAKKATDKEE